MNYHFIAIGGIGMSGLAKYLIERGETVSGSDICDSKYIHKLIEMGANVHIGHDEKNLPENSIVVVSSAIKENNPELTKAKRDKMTIFHRSDILEKVSHIKGKFIGFSGTHGKTTTSGLAAYILAKADLNPSYVVGGIIPELDNNAHYAGENYFVAELDESDGTIVKYTPDILILNNLEADHIDYYKDGMTSLIKTFETYFKTLVNTKIILNADDNGVNCITIDNAITFAIENNADYKAANIKFENKNTSFDIYKKGKFLSHVKLKIPGIHNVYNALAVAAALDTAGVDIDKISSYFSEFSGMGRRLQRVLDLDGIPVYDDYAHHPTEIKATLTALKTANPDKNIIAVFQPHRYTRLQAFWKEFRQSFGSASRVIVTDVYSASEEIIDGINSSEFVKDFDLAQNYPGSMADVAKKLLPTLKSGDIIVGLGAGTITELGNELKKAKEEILWAAK